MSLRALKDTTHRVTPVCLVSHNVYLAQHLALVVSARQDIFTFQEVVSKPALKGVTKKLKLIVLAVPPIAPSAPQRLNVIHASLTSTSTKVHALATVQPIRF